MRRTFAKLREGTCDSILRIDTQWDLAEPALSGSDGRVARVRLSRCFFGVGRIETRRSRRDGDGDLAFILFRAAGHNLNPSARPFITFRSWRWKTVRPIVPCLLLAADTFQIFGVISQGLHPLESSSDVPIRQIFRLQYGPENP